MCKPSTHLKRIRTIADYQFGRGVGDILFPDCVEFQFSSTRRIRQILLDNERIATVRANDGMLTLSMKGAEKLHGFIPYPAQRVVVSSDAAPFAAKGKTVFSRHVEAVDPEIRAGQEVLIVDANDRLLATGKTMLSALEMRAFKRGIAVDVRSGIESKDKPDNN